MSEWTDAEIDAYRAEVLTHACPRCEVAAGEHCQTKGGRRSTYPHGERQRLVAA